MEGAELTRIREAAGMKQPEFAELLGIHSVSLSRFERERESISRTVELAIYELARRLKVDDALPPIKSASGKSAKKKTK